MVPGGKVAGNKLASRKRTRWLWQEITTHTHYVIINACPSVSNCPLILLATY